MMEIKLKKARCSQLMTQKQLSEKSGITQQYIYKLESGKLTNPTRQIMLKISSALGVSVQELFFSEEE